MRTNIYILLAFFACDNCYSQNLAPNSSFEIISNCSIPIGGITLGYCPDWFTPGGGSADLFNQCSSLSQTRIPNNFVGSQYPVDGIGYVGATLYSNGPFREYLEAELNEPLLSGRKYCVQFFVSLSDSSKYAIDAVGIFFSADSLFQTNTDPILVSPQVQNGSGNIIPDTMEWTLISGTFIAGGGEKFLTIGNFKNDANTNFDTLATPLSNSIGRFAYYYFDSVSVVLCDTLYEIFVPTAFSPNNDGQNDILFVRSESVKELRFEVYNRWGEMVFRTNDITQGWDGSFKNEPLNNGVFVYVVSGSYINGETFYQKGDVSLIR